MRRAIQTLVAMIVLVVAGCVTGGPGVSLGETSSTSTPVTTALTASPTTAASSTTPTTGAGSLTDSPGGASPTSAPSGTTVKYHVRAGDIPEEIASVTVILQVIFVEQRDDLGPCYPGIYQGPYKPTITPLPTPRGDCHRSGSISLNLTEFDGEHTIGPMELPESARGHALIVTTLRATYQNGTSITAIKGRGGRELIAVSEHPAGTYGIRLGIGPAQEDAEYKYWLLSERFDPTA